MQILQSNGLGELDRLTKSYVIANWRYIPASVEGKPAQDWAAVFVRFGAS